MADDDYDFDGDDNTPEEPSPRDLRVQLKEAKAKARQAEELRQENERLRTSLTLNEAGLKLNELQQTALKAAHTGSWDADAVRKTAEALGFAQAPPPPPPPVDDPSLGQIDQIAAAAAGTDAPPASRDAELDARINNATTEAELLAIYRESGRPLAQ